jgi:PadR family transcriptional regulator, regulatory protein PadR
MPEVRLTIPVQHVLRHFSADITRPMYGYELMQGTGFRSSELYPILARLVAAGWLARERETVDPTLAGRPARFTYVLTPDGVARACQELGEHSARPPHWSAHLRVGGSG